MERFAKTDIIHRTLTGCALAVVLLAALYTGGIWWHLMVAVIALISLWEFYAMVRRFRSFPIIVGMVAGAVILYGAKFPQWGLVLFTVIAALFCVFSVELIKREQRCASCAIVNAGIVVAGLLYIVVPWNMMVYLRTTPFGHVAMLTLLLCTWSCDVFAYLVGMMWGRFHPVSQTSPNKSLEGFIGGAVASCLCAALCAFFWSAHPTPFLAVGLICGTAGQLGDLFESLIKREAGVKDSGVLLPGHGGYLDRFDSILVSGAITTMVWGLLL